MTPLRRLALKISCLVIRAAAVGEKEWAQATAREIEFVEGDWAALRWAFGSMRILLRRGEAPISSLAEVPQAAQRFAREIRTRTVIGCAACAYVAYWLGRSLPTMANPTQRFGSYLTIGAMLYMVAQLLVRRGSLSPKEKLLASPIAYRGELLRQRDFHQGAWLWSRVVLLVPGYLLFCWGRAIAHPASAGHLVITAVAFLALCGLGVPNNLVVARKYQRRIDDLDAIERNEV